VRDEVLDDSSGSDTRLQSMSISTIRRDQGYSSPTYVDATELLLDLGEPGFDALLIRDIDAQAERLDLAFLSLAVLDCAVTSAYTQRDFQHWGEGERMIRTYRTSRRAPSPPARHPPA
jgi:hypothetical protein